MGELMIEERKREREGGERVMVGKRNDRWKERKRMIKNK